MMDIKVRAETAREILRKYFPENHWPRGLLLDLVKMQGASELVGFADCFEIAFNRRPEGQQGVPADMTNVAVLHPAITPV